MAAAQLTVLFEEPFWVGLYEREDDGLYAVCKVTFGAEPKDYALYAFMLEHWKHLVFTPVQEAADERVRRISPKRRQRQIQRQIEASGVGTKAQQAVKLAQEQRVLERKKRGRSRREEASQRRFQMRQEKRKEKHRGH